MDFKAKIKQEWPSILIVAAAAVARLTLLGMKPPHFDEGVNGWFIDEMKHTGFYHYDPTNYHGPLHFYILFAMQQLFGRHVWALRLPLALASTGAVWFTLAFGRFVGKNAARWAAAAMAVSPGCVFYGRYAIHEYWLVLALMLCAWGMGGLWQTGERKYMWALWSGITLAVLTKETYILHFAAGFLTVLVAWVMGFLTPTAERSAQPEQTRKKRPPAQDPWQAFLRENVARGQWTWRDMGLGALMFVGLVGLFYSGTFMDMKGLKGLYEAYDAWAKTGSSGNGHEKAWYYWLRLMGIYEWPSAVGLAVSLMCVLPRTPRFVRGLSIYGCGALTAYSIIHYKTPWCIVSLTWPFLLLFGYGLDFAIQRAGKPLSVMAATLLAANAGDMIYLNYFDYTNPKQLYVYVQTFKDINKLMDPLNKLVAKNPANYQLSGNIVVDSYHPLPWLLGDFPNVGYYDDTNTHLDQDMDADFLLVEEARIDEVESLLKDRYFTAPLTIRDAQDPSELYLRAKTFASIFPGRKPEFVPSATPTPAAPATTPAAAGRPSQ